MTEALCGEDPSTSTVLGKVANCDLADFQRAIDSAYNAQQEYFGATTATTRGSLLRKWFDLIIANTDDRECPSRRS